MRHTRYNRLSFHQAKRCQGKAHSAPQPSNRTAKLRQDTDTFSCSCSLRWGKIPSSVWFSSVFFRWVSLCATTIGASLAFGQSIKFRQSDTFLTNALHHTLFTPIIQLPAYPVHQYARTGMSYVQQTMPPIDHLRLRLNRQPATKPICANQSQKHY